MKQSNINNKELNIIKRYIHYARENYKENETWQHNVYKEFEPEFLGLSGHVINCIGDLMKYHGVETLSELSLKLVTDTDHKINVNNHITPEQRELYWSNMGGKPSLRSLIPIEEYILSLKFTLTSGTKKQLSECNKMIQTYYNILSSMLSDFKPYILSLQNYDEHIKELNFFPFVMPITKIKNEVKFDIYNLKELKEVYEKINLSR